MKRTYILIGIVLLLAAAAVILLIKEKKPPPEWTPQKALVPAGVPEITDQGQPDLLLKAIDHSLSYYKKLPPDRRFTFGPDNVSVSHMIAGLEEFKQKLRETGFSEAFFAYVKEDFRFYRTAGDDVLVTGYYETELNGSRAPSDTYEFPLYRKPDDLVKVDLTQFSFYRPGKGIPKSIKGRITPEKEVVPYYSREEIDDLGRLGGLDLELVWIDDPVDVFFLQIQGSGIVQLDTGEKVRVNYAGGNGHPYRAVGRLLIQKGAVSREEMSMQKIREYLENHPDDLREVFNYNPSYVFFREVERGPIGSLGVPVTALRSVATDYRLFPKGALVYIETELPEFDESGTVTRWNTHRSFVVNQDTGGAIRGPGRVDFFTGHGKESELIAGHMKQPGMFYFLVKKK